LANLTYEELKAIFAHVTFLIKGLDPANTSEEVQKLVRLAYEEDSQPFNSISDDTTYIWLSFKDDPTNELFDKTSQLVATTDEHGVVTSEAIHSTRAQNMPMDLAFTFYGNTAFDSAQKARVKLMNQEVFTYLRQYDIYLVKPLETIKPKFENIGNRWWKRADFTASFNVPFESTEVLDIITSVPLGINSLDVTLIKED
jgi:hypothetical protein